MAVFDVCFESVAGRTDGRWRPSQSLSSPGASPRRWLTLASWTMTSTPPRPTASKSIDLESASTKLLSLASIDTFGDTDSESDASDHEESDKEYDHATGPSDGIGPSTSSSLADGRPSSPRQACEHDDGGEVDESGTAEREVFENQTYSPYGGWGAQSWPGARPSYSDRYG